MHSLVHIGMLALEGLFLAGAAGSIIVVLISGAEDLKTVFTRDEPNQKYEPIGD